MQSSRLKLLNLAFVFRLHSSPAMQFSRLKSLATLTILCLLPLGLRAQTAPSPIVISDAQTSVQALIADQTLTVEAPDGSVILSTGTAVTGAGGNTITNSGEISSADALAIDISADGFTLTNNAGAVIRSAVAVISAQTGVTITNAGTIEATTGSIGTEIAILLQGTADATMLTNNPTRPAHDASETLRDAYYFNAKITNATTGVIRTENNAQTIELRSLRNQIINHGNITVARDGLPASFPTADAILFAPQSGQSFIHNTGTISSVGGNAITASRDTNTSESADGIVIHNTGTIESGSGTAILLQSLNLVVNSSDITGTGANGIRLEGPADATMLTNNPTRPAYNASDATRDAYYFNNKVINEVGGTITGGTGTGNTGIFIVVKRVQIINHGDITVDGTNAASSISAAIVFNFLDTSTADEGFVYNTGNITSTGPFGTIYAEANRISGGVITGRINAITIHNDGGTIENTGGPAIELRNLNLIVNSGTITGGTNGNGIHLRGAALAATVANNPTAPAYDTATNAFADADRDAYYFNNKVINEVVGTGSDTMTGTITGKGTGSGILIEGARAQILNNGGDIVAEGTGHGIYFNTGSGQGFVYNTGNITAASGNAIVAESGADAITIHNDTGGTIESTSGIGIILRSLNLVVNSGAITGGTDGIRLDGTANANTITANPDRPAYDTTDAALRDDYYFNNTIINETGGTITGAGAGHGINIGGARAQILNNGGDIVAEGTGHGIYFNTGSGEGFVYNTGNITAASGNAIVAESGADAIVIHNDTGGTIESTASTAIVLQSLNLIVNSGTITASSNGNYRAIYLQGTADADTITANPTRPVYDATGTDLAGKWSGYDAYYFNAKITNEATGIIQATGLATAIDIETGRIQIINRGTIEVTDSGDTFTSGGTIAFAPGANQGFVYNTGTIRSFDGVGISTAGGVLNGVYTPANATTEIVIHNDGGTIESTLGTAISINSLSLIVNSGTIEGATSIVASGVASASMIAAQATRPAYEATGTDLAGKWSGYDAYYFNIKILNEAAGTIRSNAAAGSVAIILTDKRIQIINHGAITGRAPSHSVGVSTATSAIFFRATNGAFSGLQEASQNFLYNTGTISSLGPDATILALYVNSTGFAAAESNAITIHNDGGTIEAAASTAIELRSLNLIVNSGAITGGTNGNGIQLSGTALQATLDANATAPAYDTATNAFADADRDAYYFNNKVINEVVGTSTGTITGKGTNHGIRIDGARAQILNTGGDIVAEASGHGIRFNTGSGQGFVQNSGNITSASGAAIGAISGIDEITIHNTGTIESTSSHAIVLRSLNLVVNSNAITGGTNGHGIQLSGTADATMVTDNPNRPAYDTADAALRDAYYFNNKVINEVVGSNTGTITGKGTDGHGIEIVGARAQILNTGGSIVAEGTGHGIFFNAGSGQGFVQNTGSITAASGVAIGTASVIDAIVIHNTGTLESTASTAIVLQSLNLVVNTGEITGALSGIQLSGTADATMLANNPTAPAYNATDTDRDAYYFNNKVINETGGTITGAGTGHGILITGTRAQILNTGGSITAGGDGAGIYFFTGSGEGFVYNTGSITAAIIAIAAVSGIDAIIIHNTGTMESTSSHAIVLQSLNLVVNSGDITGGTDSDGIQLAGTPLQATLDANPTAPAWDASETDRDAYYFNNIIINEVGGTITGKGTDGHGIHIVNKRAQIFNYGDIDAEGTGHGIYFAAGSGESIVVNTGNIRSVNGWGIYADDATAGAIVVINGGCIEGGLGAIRLSGADDILVIRSGSKITGNVDFDDGSDELIYASAEASGRLAASVLLNLETTSESDSTSDLGAVTPEPTPTPDSDPDSTPDPNDGSGGGPNDGSGGGGSGSGSGGSLGNYQSLFALSDELILDLNAGIQDALYEHNFGPHSEKNASKEPSLWARGFGSFRKQDETDDNAKANHNLGGILVGYDLPHNQHSGIGFFLGAALGTLDTDDDAELTSQNFFGGVNLDFARDNFFYGVNLTIGFTSHESERSVEESGEDVKIEGDYSGFFLSPEFIIGMKNQVNGMNITPSLRVRYTFAFLGEYDEDGSAANRISAEKRNTGTIESRAQVAFPLQLANQAWKLEPRLGLQYRFDLNKSDFDVETTQTETAINYDVEKESTLGFFGGLSVQYLKENTAFKFNVDTIYGSESLVLRAQAGFGFQF